MSKRGITEKDWVTRNDAELKKEKKIKITEE